MKFKLEEIEAVMEDMEGFCIKCGHQQSGVEPDARKYKCEDCGEDAVYGAEELIIMGLVE
jgi:Zn finger protein HypA/HybF involved in hydrogenase expression